jgi:excisionase family DNA binding protein
MKHSQCTAPESGAGSVSNSNPAQLLCSRMAVEEIAARLNLGRQAVYAMLEQGILPGIRLGRRWIITRHAYLDWERTCGTPSPSGFNTQLEVMD